MTNAAANHNVPVVSVAGRDCDKSLPLGLRVRCLFCTWLAQKILTRHSTIEQADGAILFTPESYEPEAVKAFKGWFAETGRPAYVSGPLLPSASKKTANETEKKLSKESAEIQEFLDETLKTSGEKSLIYVRSPLPRILPPTEIPHYPSWYQISFGSIFWPLKTPEKVWAFLDVIMELKKPFVSGRPVSRVLSAKAHRCPSSMQILSHASPLASIPDETREKVNTYGRGVLSPWTPQQLILDHPV